MKKIVAVLLVAVCCLLWAGCAQATNSDDTQKEEEKQEEQESQKAKENREYYKNNLIGKWYGIGQTGVKFDDEGGSSPILKLSGMVSEFREDGFTIGSVLTVNDIDFETLFDRYIPSGENKFEPSDLKSDTVYLKFYTDENKKSFENVELHFYWNKNWYDVEFNHQKVNVDQQEGYPEGYVYWKQYYVKEGSENHKRQLEEEKDKETINIRGSYTLTDNSLNHSLTFNNNGTYDFVHATNPSWNRSNSWSTNKNEITMGWEEGGFNGTEVLVASKSGATVTLEVKDSSVPASVIRSFFSIYPDRKMILVGK
jgi:hypothetical protein